MVTLLEVLSKAVDDGVEGDAGEKKHDKPFDIHL